MTLRTLLLATVPLAAACQTFLACTEIGCQDGLSIVLNLDAPLDDGVWTLEVDTDDGLTTCAFEVSHTCAEGDVCVTSDCDTLAWSAEQGEVDTVYLWLVTDDETVDVYLDDPSGTERFAASETVTYETFAPNGEQCGPICTSASLELDVAL